MPTYDYKCDACGHEFERFHSITAAAMRKCPKCGKLKLRRLIGPGAGLIFKGSGFYITDYRSEGYKNAAKGESGATDTKDAKPAADTKPAADAKPKSEPASGSGSEPKPAPKSEPKPKKK